MQVFIRTFRITIISLLCIILLQRSVIPSSDPIERIRKFTRQTEFDYATWTINAAGVKTIQMLLDYADLPKDTARHDLVIEYTTAIQDLRMVNYALVTLYSDPGVPDPVAAAMQLIAQRNAVQERIDTIGPVVETILQQQVSTILAGLDLTTIGSPVPPVLFHSSPLPYALIVSPREIIRQDANISIETGMTLEDRISLEEEVAAGLNVSALVEEVGGIGTYPTMVQETEDLSWLIEVIAHEWTHNYLNWHPLGVNYDTTPELRTMNETTASLAGKEIASAVIAQYYPERVPPPAPPANEAPPEQPEVIDTAPVFDFRAEMHTTRVHADELLADGKIEEAEDYMEQRRLFLWENGYQIRKLNQAYFAFHGAYADQPGGAAGEDPVGPAVRSLREKSASLADFIHVMSRFTSFQQLQQALGLPVKD
ncbi:MAG: hypothetical protein C0391_08895 [Anaerolinea sp.]|nr:hypothetical protein [Anaerolinea sp.]